MERLHQSTGAAAASMRGAGGRGTFHLEAARKALAGSLPCLAFTELQTLPMHGWASDERELLRLVRGGSAEVGAHDNCSVARQRESRVGWPLAPSAAQRDFETLCGAATWNELDAAALSGVGAGAADDRHLGLRRRLGATGGAAAEAGCLQLECAVGE